MVDEIQETNCWDYMHCDENKRCSCPAYLEKCGGTCWFVAGTLCKDAQPQGQFTEKIEDCKNCKWYQWKVYQKAG